MRWNYLRAMELELHSSHHTIRKVLDVSGKARINWPLSENITNEMLMELLFPEEYQKNALYMLPDYLYIHTEQARNGLTEAERLRHENRMLQTKLKEKEMEIALQKADGAKRRRLVSGVRQEDSYIAFRYLHETEKYPITKLCAILSINRSSCYKWLMRKPRTNQILSEEIIFWIKESYEEQNSI